MSEGRARPERLKLDAGGRRESDEEAPASVEGEIDDDEEEFSGDTPGSARLEEIAC